MTGKNTTSAIAVVLKAIPILQSWLKRKSKGERDLEPSSTTAAISYYGLRQQDPDYHSNFANFHFKSGLAATHI